MALKAKYCSQCAAPVEVRIIEDRLREVCAACNTVFYRNPLPVAASVVLNEKRQVLLIKRKREPHQGMWCLPIGFAEVQETIEEAALRELQEEAGISGQVLRLLDTDSFTSDFYGDLLIVTFEMSNVAGVEQAGDDAEELAYFHLDQLPPLAFGSNYRALQACIKAHEEEWAIQDSFNRLQEGEGDQLLSDALVAVIEDHAEQILRLWLEDVATNPTTPSYRNLDCYQLLAKATSQISHFGRWLRTDQADHEVRAFWTSIGRERKAQGVEAHEVLSALTLMRKHLFNFARRQGVWERPIDVYRVLELNRRIALFFDKAMYHAIKGYAEE